MFPQIYTTQSRTRKRGIAGGLDVEKHTRTSPAGAGGAPTCAMEYRPTLESPTTTQCIAPLELSDFLSFFVLVPKIAWSPPKIAWRHVMTSSLVTIIGFLVGPTR